MSTEQKAASRSKENAQKELFMVRWNCLAKTAAPVMTIRGLMLDDYISFDKTREGAERRIAYILSTQNKNSLSLFETRTGLIEVVKHQRSIKETKEGTVSHYEKHALSKIEVVKELLPRIDPVDSRPAFPKFEGKIQQCFLAVIDDITPTGKRMIEIIAVPIERGVESIYQGMERSKRFPDSACVRDDTAIVADIVDPSFAKAMQDREFYSLIEHPMFNTGFSSRFGNDVFKNLVSIDEDALKVNVEREGRFADYAKKIKAMQRSEALQKLKASAPSA